MTKCRAGFATDGEQMERTHLKEISPPQYHIYIDNITYILIIHSGPVAVPIKNHGQDSSTSQ